MHWGEVGRPLADRERGTEHRRQRERRQRWHGGGTWDGMRGSRFRASRGTRKEDMATAQDRAVESWSPVPSPRRHEWRPVDPDGSSAMCGRSTARDRLVWRQARPAWHTLKAGGIQPAGGRCCALHDTASIADDGQLSPAARGGYGCCRGAPAGGGGQPGQRCRERGPRRGRQSAQNVCAGHGGHPDQAVRPPALAPGIATPGRDASLSCRSLGRRQRDPTLQAWV